MSETTPASAEELVADHPIVVRLPIHWGEMDAYDHVNNTVFFRYFETARIHYFERCGFLASYERDRIGAILHSTSCRFRRPLHFPDTVLVGARVTELGEDRFTMGYRIVSLGQEALAAEGSGIIVSFDYSSGHKAAVPEAVRRRILEMEAGRLGS